jgi:hypothetical protein
MRLRCIVVLLVLSPAPALAQQTAAQRPPSRLIISDRAIAMALEKHPPAITIQSRDSVKNGAILGAVIGAVALAAPGAWICHMLREPGDPPCWKGVVTVGAIGAGIGAAAGAGVDALFVREQRRLIQASR